MSELVSQKVKKLIVPLLPLKDVILFPHMVTPLLVGRERSIRAIESSMEKDQKLFFVLQRVTKANDPTSGHHDDLQNPIGTLGTSNGPFTRSWTVTPDSPREGLAVLEVIVSWETPQPGSVRSVTLICESASCT